MKLKGFKDKLPAKGTPDTPQKDRTLRDIKDTTMPFKIIYSGVENDSYFDILYGEGIRNFLMSYHYIQNMHISMKSRFAGKNIRLFIDSGAHTYQNDPKYAEESLEYWENHLKKYLSWVEKNKEYIFAIASFDFENLVGGEVVDRWNKQYFEPFMLRTGIPVCFVWHQNSYQTWDYYCERYPYVGFSSVNTEGVAIDLQEYKVKLRIAEKFNSLVHGFGMTRTSMLTQLPFYTVDSTTWLVGLQYGEINYWTGSKMSRLKKDKWKTDSILEELNNRYTIDIDKLREEDVTEFIRVNIGAFKDAQEYIDNRLKSQMYWLKAKAQKVDVNNLSEDFFPDPEAIGNNTLTPEQVKEYASKMNINPEYEAVEDVVYDMTAFMNWNNPAYSKLLEWYKAPEQEDVIRDLHDLYINRIVSSKEEMYEDLIKFFTECLSGENDKLLQLGTNFDRIVKEREHYIEEEETEVVDLTEEQVRDKISYLLPTPQDEVDEVALAEVDKNIFSHLNIKPQFDEKGKFLKGQTIARKPKKVYSDKYPKLACDTCLNAAKCPEYKSGYVCAYNKMFKRFDTRSMTDIMEGMQSIVSFNMERMQRAMIAETLNGVIDPTTSQLMDTNIRYMNMLKQMYENSSQEVLRQSRVVRGDGTYEETTQVVNPQSGGILEKLFGNMSEPVKKEEVVVTEAKEVE